MFLNPDAFEFVATLESNWRLIRSELEALEREYFVAWPERALYNRGWDVFGLYSFGLRVGLNCRLCPETARLVESIPGMTTAGFSSLQPGTRISPHVGYTKAVLRCHLGLVVPPGCALRVGGETRTWQEGRCLVFDDTAEHEAWNDSPSTRVVLLVDFKRPAESDAGVGPRNPSEASRRTGRRGRPRPSD